MENTHWKTHRQSLRGHSDASGLPTPPRPPKDGSVQRIVADRCGGFGLKKWTALATALVFTWSMCVSPVMAETINLEGGSVEVNTQENTTNWNVTGNPVWNVPEFNVPQNSIYNITGLNQNASLALLVNGGQATNIFGTMNLSNLDFILQNIAGINIGSTGMINLNNASILASTIPLNLNVTDFLAHDYQFSGQGGFLMNDGKIVGNNADLVALIANAIENQGTIEVPMGTVAFAAGNTVTVGISGDGLVSIGVDEATANTMGLKDQIKNTGTITADGGKVILNAQAMDGLFEKAINLQSDQISNSIIRADNGRVEFQALGDITNEGIIQTKNGEFDLDTFLGSFMNKGTITAPEGNVQLTAGQSVYNQAIIEAVKGKVEVIAKEGEFKNDGTIDVTDGKVSVTSRQDITNNAIMQAQRGEIWMISKDGSLKNAGDIKANGGSIKLTAEQSAYNQKLLEAMSGKVEITANKGEVRNAGTIDATQGVIDVVARESVMNEALMKAAEGAISVTSTEGAITNPGTMDATGGSIEMNAAGIVETQGALKARDVVERGAGFRIGGRVEVGTIDMDNLDNRADIYEGAQLSGSFTDQDDIWVYGNFSLIGDTSIITDSNSTYTDGILNWSGAYLLTGNNYNLTLRVPMNSTVGAITGVNVLTFDKKPGSTPTYTGSASDDIHVNSIVVTSGTTFSKDAVDGSGNHLIYTALDAPGGLQYMDQHLDYNYKLENNINASGISFTPVGYSTGDEQNYATNPFIGNFDGAGYTITSLAVSGTNFVGLFGATSGSTITNVGLVGGSASGASNVGGLVGQARNTTISSSYNTGTVSASRFFVGGLVGDSDHSSVTSSYATGNVTGNQLYSLCVGGLVGDNNYSSITSSYATGNVAGGPSYSFGGLAGRNFVGNITSSYSTGTVGSGSSDEVGGLVGTNFAGTITSSYATGNVNGFDSVGGLVGFNEYNSTITSSYALGNVSGSTKIGGLVGYNYHSGASIPIISTSFSKGTVTAGDTPGGFIGNDTGSGTLANNYWDYEAAGLAQTQDIGNSGNVAGITGQTTAQMKQQTSFTGWDPGTWGFDGGVNYPSLYWKNSYWTGLGADNNWSTAANWNNNTVPGAGALVFFNNTSTKAATLDSGFGGNITYLGIGSGYTNTITQSRALTISGDYAQAAGVFTGGTSIDLNGSILLSGGTFTAPATMTVAKNWSKTGGTFTAGSNTVTFDGTGTQTLDSGGSSFGNVAHTGSSTLQLLTNALTTTGTLSNSTGTFDANDLAVTAGGLATVSGGTYLAKVATQTFNAGLTMSGTGSFTGSTGAVDATDISISGTGIFTAPSGEFTVSGNWSKTGGTFTAGTGTVTFDGVGARTLNSGGSSFSNILYSGAGLLQLSSSDLTMTGTFTNLSSIFDANDRAVTAAGLVTVSGGSYLAKTGTQTFNGGLLLSGSGGLSGSTGAIDVTDITIAESSVLIAPTGAFTISGNWSKTGGTFTAGSNTVTFDGTGTQTLDSGGSSFGNVAHTGSSTLQLLTNALTTTGTLSNSTGTFDANDLAVTAGGLATVSGGTYLAKGATQTFNAGLTMSGTGSFTGSTGAVDATDISISGTGTFTAPSGEFTVSGNWSKTGGTFTAGSNTVTFDAGAIGKTITPGGSSFYDITFDNASGGWTISGAMTVTHDFRLTTGAVTQSSTLAVTHDYIQTGGTFAATSPNTNTMTVGNSFSIPATSGAFNRFTGSGASAIDPYLVYDVYGLQGMRGYLAGGKYFKLNDNIVATGTANWNTGAGFVPVGNDTAAFTGNFDGNIKTISGLTMARTLEKRVGLFGSTSGATVRNVGLVGGSTSGTNTQQAYVGSLIGQADNTTIANAYATGNVSGSGDYNYGVGFGGLVGFNYNNSSVTDSYATGDVNGNANVGGLVGRNWSSAVIADSRAEGDVTASSISVGGLVGEQQGTVNSSYATGNVASTNAYVGGLAGYNSGTINYSYATGNVNAPTGWDVGGLAGFNYYGTISNSYATGSVNGGSQVGGLVGLDDVNATVTNSYSKGNVSGTGADVGGLIGRYEAGAVLTNNYWDYETAGMAQTLDTGNNGDVAGITGMTIAEMKQQATFLGWDFGNVWAIDEGNVYPTLQHQYYVWTGTGNTSLGSNWNKGVAPGASDWVFFNNSGTNNATVDSIFTVGKLAIGSGYTGTITQSNALNVSGNYTQGGGTFSGSAAMDVDGNFTLTGGTFTAPTTLNVGGDWIRSGGTFTPGTRTVIFDAGATGKTITSGGSSFYDLQFNNASGGWTILDPMNVTHDMTLTTGAVTQSSTLAITHDYIQAGGTFAATTPDTNTMTIGNSFSIPDTAGAFNRFGGSGTSGSPYLIYDVYGLQGMKGYLASGTYFQIANDIVAGSTSAWNSGAGFDAIGNFTAKFGGNFNGNSKTITGLAINRPTEDYIGLFGYTNAATIQNVGLVGGSVSGSASVGGLVGRNESSAITSSYATGSVSGDAQVGGLAGESDETSNIANSYSTGNVSGAFRVGGLVGNSKFSSITNSYATGIVSGSGSFSGSSGSVGGLVGQNYDSTIENSFSTGVVTSTNDTPGGVVGYYTGGTLTSNYWDTQISGLSNGFGTGSTSGVTGKTTAEMKQQATFSGWDFGSTWKIYEGLAAPLLKSFLTPLTVTANASTETYNGTTAFAGNGVNYSLVPSAELLGTVSFTSPSKNVGTYVGGLTPTGLYSTQQGYDITYVGGDLTITPRMLNVSATGTDKVYDATTHAAVTLSDNRILGDVLTGLYAAASFDDKNVGTGKNVSVSGIEISGTDAGNYTLVSSAATATADITPLEISVSGVTANNKVYDATTTATVNTGSASLVGVLGGDVVGLDASGKSGVFANKNVGTGKAVTVSGLGLSGTDAGNYTLGQPVGITADITQATLTWSGVTANNKTYDGTIVATVSGGTLTGKLGSDNVTVNSTGAFGDKNVGASKTVTLLNELNGADAANYALVDQTTTTADITALGITVSGVTVNHKVYDATAAATVNTGSAALVGVLGGDTVSLDASGKSGVFANKNVGTGKSVTVSGLGLSGTDAINYALSQPVGITADITALGITVSGVTADSKVYDATTVAAVNTGSAALVGVLGGDTVDLDDAAKSGVFADKNVGTDKGVTVSGLALSGTDALNYTLSQPVGLTADITKASVTLTGITVNNKVYDATTAATTNTAGATFTGKLGSDVLTVISSTGAFEDKNVGMGKTVTLANTLGGADLGNYDITDQTTTTANITAKALTVSGVTASNKVYDATTAANLNTGSATLMGVVGGDSVNLNAGVGAGIFADKNAGTGKAVTISGLALTGTDASNYSLIQPAGLTADITKASVTLTGITASNKTYDATTVASVSGGTFSGKYAGDDLTVSSTGVFIDKHVGTGKTVTLTNVIGGADLGNYNVTDQGTTTANITAKALTISGVTASNKVYDATTTAAVDAGSAVLFGILGGDLVTLGGVATGAFVDKNVGTGKGVTVSGLALSGTDASNYTLSQPVGLTADITRASVTLTGITASNKTYDATTVATVSGGTFSGKYAGDVLTVSSTGVFSDKNVGTGKTVTLTNILGGADLGNYDVTDQTTTTANITAKALTVSGVTVSNKVYDATTAATVNTGSASLVGVLGGDTVSLDTVSKSGAFGNKNVGTGKSVTVSGLSLAGGDASNYAISQPTGLTADITKASVTLSGITASNKTYDQTLTATVSTAGAVFAGKYAGDVLTVSSTGVFSDKNAGNGKTVFLSNTLGGADLANYDISDQGTTTANITARPLTITATGVNKVYDGGTTATVNLSDNRLANDVLTASYTTAVYADGSVGTAKPITVSGISITGADALNYIVDATSTAFADITAAPVTVTTPPPTAVDPPPIIIPVTPGPIIVTPPPVVIVEAPRGDNVPLPINIENPAVPASPVITPAAPPASESQTPVGLENAEVAVEDTLDETDVVPESETPAITDSEPVPVVTVEADESKAETKTTEASPEKKSESTEEEKTTPVKDEEKNVQWRDVPVTGFASLDDGRKFLTDVRVIEGAVYVVDSMNTMSLLGLGDSMRVLYKKRTRKSLKPAKKVVIQEAPKSSEDMAKPEDLELPAKTTEVPEVPAMPEVKKALSQVLNAVKQEPEAEPAPEDRVLKAALPVVMQQTAGGDRYGVLKNPGKDVFVRSRDGEWLAAKDGMIILPGDEVKTARDNSVEMLMDGGKTGRVEIKEGSLFRIQKAETDSLTGDKRTLLELAMGKILVKVEALKGNSKFEVRTPTALTGVRGTVFEVTVKEKS